MQLVAHGGRRRRDARGAISADQRSPRPRRPRWARRSRCRRRPRPAVRAGDARVGGRHEVGLQASVDGRPLRRVGLERVAPPVDRAHGDAPRGVARRRQARGHGVPESGCRSISRENSGERPGRAAAPRRARCAGGAARRGRRVPGDALGRRRRRGLAVGRRGRGRPGAVARAGARGSGRGRCGSTPRRVGPREREAHRLAGAAREGEGRRRPSRSCRRRWRPTTGPTSACRA